MMSSETPKWGSEHASAMFRQGLRELRGALYPESNVAQQPEYGLYGTVTPGEVAASRRDSIVEEKLQQIDNQPAPEQEPPQKEREE